MIRLSKKIEYALLALQFIAANRDKVVSAKELALELGISFEFLAKTLQKLNKSGFIESQQGIKGGYILTKEPAEIAVSDVINALEGHTHIVDCFNGSEDDNCMRSTSCSIKHPMMKIQKEINDIFKNTTIAELINENYPLLAYRENH